GVNPTCAESRVRHRKINALAEKLGNRGRFPGTQLHNAKCCYCEIESSQAFAGAPALRNLRCRSPAREFAPVTKVGTTFLVSNAEVSEFSDANCGSRRETCGVSSVNTQ